MSLRTIARRAAPRQYPRQQAGRSIPIPAPSLGMNTRDGVASLDAKEARLIRNMIAENGRLVIRKGQTEHQEVAGADLIGTMFTHQGVSADVLLAAADGEIYDVTGTPSALTSSSYTSDLWSIKQFNDTTIGVNGVDTPWAFDGSSVGASGFSGSGLSIEDLRTVNVVGVRLWLTEKDSADVWYGAENAITGALTKFQLSQETRGGYCVGIYGYKGATVFIMSTGEITTYQGDPGANDFAQIATYDAPRPVGYDPGLEAQGDLLIMTASGVLPFEGIAKGLSFDSSALGAWGKISPSWAEDFVSYGTNPGWNAIFYAGLLIFNVPIDATTAKQWVFNTRTKAWSYFDGVNATNFAQLGSTLYIGSRAEGKIFAYQGGTDNDATIGATVRHGFTYPFQSQVNGQFTIARLNTQASGLVTGQIQVDVDYSTLGISAPEFQLSSAGSGPWSGPWGVAWGQDGAALLRWSSIKGFGRAIAPVAQFNSRTDDLEYFATDVVVAPAGTIG